MMPEKNSLAAKRLSFYLILVCVADIQANGTKKVVHTLKTQAGDFFRGTSNVYLAQKIRTYACWHNGT